MTPEARVEQTDEGLAPSGAGWFVVNAREARWRERPGRGFSLPLTGWSDEECETLYTQLGAQLFVLPPGEPIGMYHRETDQEGFLVLAGEPLLIVEGQERRLQAWDWFHCPAGTEHMIIGAGEGNSVLLAVGSRQNMATEQWGMYTHDPVAERHGVAVEEDTPDPEIAYARWPEPRPTEYRDGWLPRRPADPV